MKILAWSAFAVVLASAAWGLVRPEGCPGCQRAPAEGDRAILAAAELPAAPLEVQVIEARSAAVFAGACHYMGEAQSNGREALIAWRLDGDLQPGLRLPGMVVVAAVAADSNLAEGGPRRSRVWIDQRANPAEAEALEDWVRASCAAVLGEIMAVDSAPIEFARQGDDFRLEVPGVLELSGLALADRACCKMPAWRCYEPLGAARARAQTVALTPAPGSEVAKTAASSPAIVGNAQRCRFEGAPGLPAWAYEGGNNVFLWSECQEAPSSGFTQSSEACAAPQAACCPPGRAGLRP